MRLRWSIAAAAAVALLIAGLRERALAFPVDGDQTSLPAKTELNEDALNRPREVFHSEITGYRSEMIKLGNLAFSSPNDTMHSITTITTPDISSSPPFFMPDGRIVPFLYSRTIGVQTVAAANI